MELLWARAFPFLPDNVQELQARLEKLIAAAKEGHNNVSSSKMGFLAHVALNDPTLGKRVHSMTPPSEQLKEISQVALNDPSLRTA